MEEKYTYILVQVDAIIDGIDCFECEYCKNDECKAAKPCWSWNQSWRIGEVKVSAKADDKAAFLRALKKLGIVCKKGCCYVAHDNDVYELRERKTDRPLYAMWPEY